MIQLKKIDFVKQMSEETPCFTAQLWDNGKHMADVGNRGYGGSNTLRPAKGLKYEDIAKYGTLDVESEIFGMVYDDGERKKYQARHLIFAGTGDYVILKLSKSVRQLDGSEFLTTLVAAQRKELEPKGYRLLNTNIKKSLAK